MLGSFVRFLLFTRFEGSLSLYWSQYEIILESLISFAFKRQTTNAGQSQILRCDVIKCETTCCFKTVMSDYSFDIRKEI